MSKLFLRSLYLMLLTLCLPSMASAQNVAKIGDTPYATLEEAVSAAQAGGTVEITVAGTYTLPGTSKNITIQGVDGVVFNHTTAGNIAAVPNGITFKNVTFNFGNVNYHGFQGTVGAVNMDNCTLNGKFFSYGDMNFTNCQFVQDNEDYHMWVYGKGTVTYTDCTFTNNVIGKFLNLYSESSTNVGNVVVKNCKFINNGTKSKAAINVKATCGSTILKYTVDVENSTADGAFPAASSSDKLVVLNPLVQVDDRPATPTTTEQITITAENNKVKNGTEEVAIENVAYEEGAVVTAAGVAKIGSTEYETLEAAFAAAKDGETITLLADCAGNGIKAPQGKFANGLTVDFGGFTYTVDGETVGSTGTETNGFQLLKGNNITFKNGTITSEKAKILVQNYSNLTLDKMTLTLDNANYTSAYTLSNNNGNTVINNTTINANPAGGFAFDVCRYASYPSVNVTVTGESKINGDVEIYASGSDAKDGFSLTLTSGTMSGNIVVDATAATIIEKTPEKAIVTKADGFIKDAPEGFKWESNGNGTSKLVEDIIVLTDGTTYNNADDITNAKVAYKRTFGSERANKYQAWMVPFDYKLTATDVANFDFYEINKIEYAEQGNTTKMQIRLSSAKAADDVLEANMPYVFMPKSAVGEYTFKAEGVTLYAAGDGTEVRKSLGVAAGVAVEFTSVYQTTVPKDAKYIYYASINGLVGYANNADVTNGFAGVGPFRWIFKVTGVNAPSTAFTFGFAADEDDDVTAVSSAAVEAEGEVVGYYNLAGQKVSEPTKGVYVVKYANGATKKVVVK